MKSNDLNSNNTKPKAYIKEKYKENGTPTGSYLNGEIVTANQIKEKYGNEYYVKLGKIVGEIINRSKKCPIVSNKIHA